MRELSASALALTLLLACFVPAATAADGAREVEALVTIRFDPDSKSVVWPEVVAVLEGSPRAGWSGEAPAILQQAAATYRDLGMEREDTDEPGVLAFRVRVTAKDPAAPADQILGALLRRLESHLGAMTRAEQEERFAQLDRLRARLAALTKEIGAVREEGALPWPLSAATFFETLLDRRHEVRGRLLDLQVEQEALAARRRVFAERLGTARAAAESQRAAIEASWASILRAREAALANEKANLASGTGHPIDVAAAEEALARARLERAEMLADPTALPGGARVATLEASLETVETDLEVLAATRMQLVALHAEMDKEIEARRADVLQATHREEELRVLRDQVLALTEASSAGQAPRVDVLRVE